MFECVCFAVVMCAWCVVCCVRGYALKHVCCVRGLCVLHCSHRVAVMGCALCVVCCVSGYFLLQVHVWCAWLVCAACSFPFLLCFRCGVVAAECHSRSVRGIADTGLWGEAHVICTWELPQLFTLLAHVASVCLCLWLMCGCLGVSCCVWCIQYVDSRVCVVDLESVLVVLVG